MAIKRRRVTLELKLCVVREVEAGKPTAQAKIMHKAKAFADTLQEAEPLKGMLQTWCGEHGHDHAAQLITQQCEQGGGFIAALKSTESTSVPPTRSSPVPCFFPYNSPR